MDLLLERVTFSYGDGDFQFALPELAVGRGESVALVGPSGSGKTTLLALIAGIVQPQSGEIRLGDNRLDQLSDGARRLHRLGRIGMIFQSFELLDYLDVRDNILLQARLAPGITIDASLEQRGQAIADELGLADRWRRPVQALSQGERQRVAACRALLLEPDLVLADEPTGNLDTKTSIQVMELLKRLNQEQGITIIMVSHEPEMMVYTDRIVHFRDGRIERIEEVVS